VLLGSLARYAHASRTAGVGKPLQGTKGGVKESQGDGEEDEEVPGGEAQLRLLPVFVDHQTKGDAIVGREWHTVQAAAAHARAASRDPSLVLDPLRVSLPPSLSHPRPSGTAERLRLGRYEALAHVADEYHARYIVTGHHADDQAETLLMRLTKGSGLAGLAAMTRLAAYPVPAYTHLRVARPLLPVTREAITDYAVAEGMRWVEDGSNVNPDSVRWRTRVALQNTAASGLPSTLALTSLAALARTANAALDMEARRLLRQLSQVYPEAGAIHLPDLAPVLAAPRPVQTRLWSHVLNACSHMGEKEQPSRVQSGLRAASLERLRAAVARGVAHTMGGVLVTPHGDGAWVTAEEARSAPPRIPWHIDEGRVSIGPFLAEVEATARLEKEAAQATRGSIVWQTCDDVAVWRSVRACAGRRLRLTPPRAVTRHWPVLVQTHQEPTPDRHVRPTSKKHKLTTRHRVLACPSAGWVDDRFVEAGRAWVPLVSGWGKERGTRDADRAEQRKVTTNDDGAS